MDKFKKLNIIYKISFVILIFMVFVGVFAEILAPYDPNKVEMTKRLMGISGEHILGTDALGRDVLSRIIYGARTSIFISFIATVCTMFLGTIIGLISGYCGGVIDNIIQVIVTIFQGLPGLSFMIAIAGVLDVYKRQAFK